MKAPDKVFFPNDINLMTKLSLVIKQKDDVCYIRKDALLEWLQNEYKANAWFYETHAKPNAIHSTRCETYKKVIEKIESL